MFVHKISTAYTMQPKFQVYEVRPAIDITKISPNILISKKEIRIQRQIFNVAKLSNIAHWLTGCKQGLSVFPYNAAGLIHTQQQKLVDYHALNLNVDFSGCPACTDKDAVPINE